VADERTYESPTPYEQARIHAAAIYCSDGRVGEQIDGFLQEGLGLPRYDRLAVPGGPACLSGSLATFLEGRALEEALRFLIRVHDLRRVVLIAHEGCAYYRVWLAVPEASIATAQRQDLEKALLAVRKLSDGLRVEAFFARPAGARIRFEAL
jgi:carbonic anhydrase-like protein